MLNSFVSLLFNKNISQDNEGDVVEQKKSKAKHIIYRDELSRTKQTKRKPKKSDSLIECLTDTEPLIKKESGVKISTSSGGGSTDQLAEKGVIRVKVVMTKQEANRLLSRCKDGGVLEFKDVARELVQIPVNRVAVFNNPPSTCSASTLLHTIPEEF